MLTEEVERRAIAFGVVCLFIRLGTSGRGVEWLCGWSDWSVVWCIVASVCAVTNASNPECSSACCSISSPA